MADMVHHMVSEQDPHPLLYDALLLGLRALADPTRIAGALVEFQWTLLCETGYRPRLDTDAQTGEPLPSHGSTLAFSAEAGGVVADTGTGDRWRVRRRTVELLRQVASGGGAEGADPDDAERANRLLAAYVRELLGSEPHGMRWAFPKLAPTRNRAPGVN
ncbi:MAG: DNA repair protein RecO, partial [Planctomycetota bacterium]|jgi:recombinational DNA repair protein (RecF pathway)